MEARRGWVGEGLAAELPGLDLYWLTVDARPCPTPEPLRERMREMAGRITGAKVIQSRQDSVPWAYRVLWRKLGVDPDTDRTPVEALMLQRLEYGGIPSRGLPNDAIVVATLDTGVPIVIADAAKLSGSPGVRPAAAGERLGATPLRTGEIVYADEHAPFARLDGELAADRAAGDTTTTMLVCALAAPAVSQIEIDEALWTAAGALRAATLEGPDVESTQ